MLYGAGGSDAPQFTRMSDGRNAAVAREQRFSDHEVVREQIERDHARDQAIIGQHGDFAGLVRSISTTSGAAAIVPTVWSSSIIDKACNAAVMFQAGATLVPMDAKIVQVGRLTTDPAPVFKTEGSAVAATDPALDYIQFTATSLSTVVVASMEVLQDAPNAEEIVTNALAKSMALEIDKAAMFGQLGATGTSDEGAAYGLE
jgi:HK97 family phage major capsid protein